MRDRYHNLKRRLQRAERIACPVRTVACILWDRDYFVEVWGPKDCLTEEELAEIGKPVRYWPDPKPPDPRDPSPSPAAT